MRLLHVLVASLAVIATAAAAPSWAQTDPATLLLRGDAPALRGAGPDFVLPDRTIAAADVQTRFAGTRIVPSDVVFWHLASDEIGSAGAGGLGLSRPRASSVVFDRASGRRHLRASLRASEAYALAAAGRAGVAFAVRLRPPPPPERVITPTEVWSTSQWGGANDGRDDHLIDGTGLSGTGEVWTRLHDDSPNAATMWHAGDTDGGLGGPLGLPPQVAQQALVFDLGESRDIAGAWIWNHNQSGQKSRGVASFRLLVSSDSDPQTASFSWVGTYDLAQASAALEAAQAIWAPASDVRLVRFEIDDAHSGAANEFVGLSEVRFVPEPSFAPSLGILSLLVAGGAAAKRRARTTRACSLG